MFVRITLLYVLVESKVIHISSKRGMIEFVMMVVQENAVQLMISNHLFIYLFNAYVCLCLSMCLCTTAVPGAHKG